MSDDTSDDLQKLVSTVKTAARLADNVVSPTEADAKEARRRALNAANQARFRERRDAEIEALKAEIAALKAVAPAVPEPTEAIQVALERALHEARRADAATERAGQLASEVDRLSAELYSARVELDERVVSQQEDTPQYLRFFNQLEAARQTARRWRLVAMAMAVIATAVAVACL